MATSNDTERREIGRRQLLTGLAATSSLTLAGCSGIIGGRGGGNQSGENRSDGNQELGERVPSLSIKYFSIVPTLEASVPTIVSNLKERLGLSVDAQSVQVSSLAGSMFADKRTSLMPLITTDYEIDPQKTMVRFGVQAAGSGIGGAGRNVMNFLNCKYTFFAHEQANYFKQDRKAIVHAAQEEFSEPVPLVPTITNADIAAWRQDQIDIGGVGPNGPGFTNVKSFTNTKTRSGIDAIKYPGVPFAYETTNFWTVVSKTSPWDNLIHSPLTQLTPEYETENDLAASISLEKQKKRVVVKLKSDATFHNGDKVTSEDVKYSYDLLLKGGKQGIYPRAPSLPMLQNIATSDEETVVFNLSTPFSPLIENEFWTWGILHKESWEAVNALKDPASAEPGTPIIGSGPYVMDNYEPGTSMYLTPYKDHHTYSPTAPIQITIMSDPQASFQGLKGGSINIDSLSVGQYEQLKDSNKIQTNVVKNIQNEFLAPNNAAAPTKFVEFRKAVAASLNHDELNTIAAGGLHDPEEFVTIYSTTHPFRAPDEQLYRMADSPSGSQQAARQHLKEAGWGWDQNGKLHYPPDADLTPLWPPGETPNPADFNCITEEGYVRPEKYKLPFEKE